MRTVAPQWVTWRPYPLAPASRAKAGLPNLLLVCPLIACSHVHTSSLLAHTGPPSELFVSTRPRVCAFYFILPVLVSSTFYCVCVHAHARGLKTHTGTCGRRPALFVDERPFPFTSTNNFVFFFFRFKRVIFMRPECLPHLCVS